MRSVNSDRAYDYIRKRILSGEFPPGHSLMTEELSEQIGVSRTPIRDALRQLEADGLVTIKARLGASVTALDLKDYREICGLRLALESYAAGLAAANRTEAELKEISYALESMRKLIGQFASSAKEEELMQELVREDVRFHIAIMSAAKNDLLKKEILRLHLINRVVSGKPPGVIEAKITKAERQARRLEVMASHEAIFSAIDRSNAAAAKTAMESHIQDIIDSNIRMMERMQAGTPTRELTEEELSYST